MIMFPKEKAKNLVDKMYKVATKNYADNDYAQILANKMWFTEAKESAKICVKEIITELNSIESKDLSDLQFWNEVDYEIDSLQNIG
ncbi:hypothetical protein Phi19:3_gp064 [Cellulophaga phage phi19:3]|uniref:Uncharacterized protein n=1 Tax=Cellulophaga phage phi19:3 TaxID=1327971 RepID=R9ZZT5_9CAUD|nr:hypothetical protein Phi19:3_gp064 [Cellulophaga phage phi19:3]AGO47468.1 hypothetical protein Phi19:3_gp064 [Cellulophaga phage phi19:3]